MNRIRPVATLTAAIAALGLVAAAPAEAPACRLVAGAETPDDPSDDVEVCAQEVWFHRADTPAGNLAASGETPYPSWDTTPPQASVTEGAGGGYLGLSPLDATGVSEFDSTSAVTYEGTFTGNLDNVAITQYLFAPIDERAYGTYYFRVQLTVDGLTVYESDFIEGDETPLKAGGDAVQRIDVALTDMHPKFGAYLGDGEHAVRVVITPFLPGDEALYVYDTTEVPSGIVFNAASEDLAGFTTIPLS